MMTSSSSLSLPSLSNINAIKNQNNNNNLIMTDDSATELNDVWNTL
jgi:hypothetical protein